MYVEITKQDEKAPLFAINELTTDEMELLQQGLIELKSNRLKDPEEFREMRRSCVDMFRKIDTELINSRDNIVRQMAERVERE